MIAMGLTLARPRSVSPRLGRRRRSGLRDARRAVPMIAVRLALPRSSSCGRIRVGWRRGCRLRHPRRAVPVVTVGLALAGSGSCGRVCMTGRRCCGLWNPRRAMPVVTVRRAGLYWSGTGASRRRPRRRGCGLWNSGRAVPVVVMGRASLDRSGAGSGGRIRLTVPWDISVSDTSSGAYVQWVYVGSLTVVAMGRAQRSRRRWRQSRRGGGRA